MPYKLSDTKKQAILESFLSEDSAANLRQEVGLLRMLAQQAIEEGNPGLAERLISACTRTSAAYVSAAIKAGQLVEKTTLLQVAIRLSDYLADSVRSYMSEDEFNRWADETLPQIPAVIESTIVERERPQITDERDEQ